MPWGDDRSERVPLSTDSAEPRRRDGASTRRAVLAHSDGLGDVRLIDGEAARSRTSSSASASRSS
jgi:hypothetical protein